MTIIPINDILPTILYRLIPGLKNPQNYYNAPPGSLSERWVDETRENGNPGGVAVDNGSFSENNVVACQKRGIEPYTVTGCEPHRLPIGYDMGKGGNNLQKKETVSVFFAATIYGPIGRLFCSARSDKEKTGLAQVRV